MADRAGGAVWDRSIPATDRGSARGAAGPDATGCQVGVDPTATLSSQLRDRTMPTVAEAAVDPSKVTVESPHTSEFLYRVAERFGLPVVILLLVLWWARTDIVQPLMTAHFQAIHAIVDGQEKHTESIESLGRKLDELISIERSSPK